MNRTSLALLCLSMLTAAAPVAPAAVDATGAVTRVYDVTDLLTVHPPHPLPAETAPPAGGGGGGSPFMSSEPTADPGSPRVKLLNAVRVALSIDESVKGVELLGDSLVVTEPVESQQAAEKLIDQLRSTSNTSTQVRIDAEWVLAPAGPLPEAAALAADPKAVIARIRTVCFNRQTVGVRQVREVSVITGATPVVGTGVSEIQVTTEIDRPGVQIEVTPQLQADRTIVVDLKAESTAHQPASMQPKPPTTRTTKDAPILQPDKVIQSFATTVSLNPGQPTIVGGVTQDTTQPDGTTLCLVLTATVLPPPATRPIWK